MSLSDPAPLDVTGPAALVAPQSGAPAARGAGAHAHLLRGSAWLVATVGVAAASGLLFWLVAARLDSTTTVGSAAALFTAVLFVNYATTLGLPVAVARYAPDGSRPARVLFAWTLLLSTLASGAGSLLFVVLGPASVVAPLWQWGRPLGVALFFLVATGTSFAVLVDVRLMAMRRWGWVLFKTLSVALVRLPLLWARPLGNDTMWLFLLVAGLPALSGFVSAALVAGATPRGVPLRPLPPHAGRALRYASVNYVSMLAAQAPQFVLPLIVAANVPASANASFYVAWSVTAVVFLLPQTIGQVLLVEGGREGSHLPAQVKLALLLTVGLTVVVTVAAAAFSGALTAVYGAGYGDAARLLPVLVSASVAWSVTSICLVEARVREAAASTVLITVTFGLAILVPAAVATPRHGVDGAARAWLAGNLVAAAVGASALLLARRRRRHATPGRGAATGGAGEGAPAPPAVPPAMAAGERR